VRFWPACLPKRDPPTGRPSVCASDGIEPARACVVTGWSLREHRGGCELELERACGRCAGAWAGVLSAGARARSGARTSIC
jgi:hypothetical protein